MSGLIGKSETICEIQSDGRYCADDDRLDFFIAASLLREWGIDPLDWHIKGPPRRVRVTVEPLED